MKYEDIPLYVVVSDVAASGGYFVAAAADKIFVNKSSLVGSIGVRMDSFGLVDLIDKWGNIRYTHIGEGAYEETEQAILTLLAEEYSQN